MNKKCNEYYTLWEKYCKDKKYDNFSWQGNICNGILQKYQECILKKK